ncbi:MAG: DUF1801 domain-containing protein [Anaerolineales bacterium]|nr:DUF1801 domain-containing protein [Anaerolineales bacterium]
MAELKTKPTGQSVARFIQAQADERRRAECQTLVDLMRQATGAEPKLWGTAIVGFGDYHYTYKSGREGDWFPIGFSPRKQNLTLYAMGGWEAFAPLLAKLGKHKLGKGCLYLNHLDEVDLPTLRKLIAQAVKQARRLERAQQ